MTPPVPSRGPRDAPGVMSARIIDAARASFAANGWAGTSLRGVARDAGVDPALVHHYFASKSALLDAATTPPPEWSETVFAAWNAAPDDRGYAIVINMLRNWSDERYRPMMTAILLAAAHDETTRAKLTAIISAQLVAPAEERLPGDDELLRASLVASHLFGVMLMRYIWHVEPLASASDDAVAALLAPTIQRYLDDKVHEAPEITSTDRGEQEHPGRLETPKRSAFRGNGTSTDV